MNEFSVSNSFLKLKNYCEVNDFSGWDPYDGLNSKFFKSIPLVSGMRLPRLAWIQLFKRSPINLRILTGVKKDYNPKGLGLFLNGYCELYKKNPKTKYLDKIHYLAKKIISLRSEGYSGSCWGYNFDWQARAFFQPKYTPTVVATTFIAYALMDAYELTGEQKYLDIAIDTKDFILKDLNRTMDQDRDFAFSYSPEDSTQVFNASLLGSRLLARIYHYTKEGEVYKAAERSVKFCCKHQKQDGSWTYGTLPFHQWIDNFHTGYNLECLSDFARYTGDNKYNEYIKKGLEYYLKTFFNSPEGMPAYYSNNTYPIDIHNTSQLIITLSKLGVFDENRLLIDKVLNWTINNMQDKKGYFYYQKKKSFSSKIPYIRWAQAWMFYGMTVYLNVAVDQDYKPKNEYTSTKN